MVIYIDKQEKQELDFSGYSDLIVTSPKALKYGDYKAEFQPSGYSPPFVFERKSHADLYGTLTNRTRIGRFKREIGRAKKDGVTLILIVEAPVRKIKRGYYYQKNGERVKGKVGGQQIMNTVSTLFTKYGLIPIFCENRDEMVWWIVTIFSSLGRKYVKEGKK